MSTGKPTPYAELNQWRLEDKLKMDEFNEDNRKIDQALMNLKGGQGSSGNIPSFIYSCTGTNDDLAIQNLVNNFFSGSTAMSMRLIITGRMGLRASPTDNIYISITATNTRGAICYLDFADCHVPDTTGTLKKQFLRSSNSATVRLVIEKLKVVTTGSGVTIGSNSTIRDSAITVTGSGSRALNFTKGNNNNIENCTLVSTLEQAIYSFGSNNNRFANCTITGGAYAAMLLANVSNNNSFANCTFTCNGSNAKGIDINDWSDNNSFINCTITATGSAVFVFCKECSFIGCTITSTAGCGVNFCNIDGVVTFSACKIIGATTGIRVDGFTTTAEIKLIGCQVKGTSSQDIQATEASTIRWYIMGNSFSRATVIVDGTTTISYKTASASIYFPQYANRFSVTNIN